MNFNLKLILILFQSANSYMNVNGTDFEMNILTNLANN